MKRTMSAIASIRAVRRDYASRQLSRCRAELETKNVAAEEALQAHRDFADNLPKREQASLEACVNQASAAYLLEDLRMKIDALHDDLAELLKRQETAKADAQEAEGAMLQARRSLQAANIKLQKATNLEDREECAWRRERDSIEEIEIEDQIAFSCTGDRVVSS